MSALRENAFTLVSTTTGIDATVVASTELFVVPAGTTFIPMMVVIRVTSYTDGGKAVQVIANFGGNAANYNDYLSGVTYTVANNSYFQVDRIADATEVTVQAAGDSFRINITTASDATTEVWAVDLFGYLV